MRNLIRLALKWIFFWNIAKTALQLEFCPQNPGQWYALVAPVCSARCPIEAFFMQKNSTKAHGKINLHYMRAFKRDFSLICN